MEQKEIVIINPSVANNLIQLGYKITRISKNINDSKRSVFHFQFSKGILDILETLKTRSKN